jgi:hypothetical protein
MHEIRTEGIDLWSRTLWSRKLPCSLKSRTNFSNAPTQWWESVWRTTREGLPILPDSTQRRPLSLRLRGACIKSIQASRGNFRGWRKTIRALTPACGRSFPALTNLKAIADYETGPGSHVSEESAREVIQTARQLVECVTGLLPPNGPTPAATPEPAPVRADGGVDEPARCSAVAQGDKTDRAQLGRLLGKLAAGDVLMVPRLDRLARSTRDLLNTLAVIAERKAGFRSLADTWADTTTSHGRLIFTVLGGLAEFEKVDPRSHQRGTCPRQGTRRQTWPQTENDRTPEARGDPPPRPRWRARARDRPQLQCQSQHDLATVTTMPWLDLVSVAGEKGGGQWNISGGSDRAETQV